MHDEVDILIPVVGDRVFTSSGHVGDIIWVDEDYNVSIKWLHQHELSAGFYEALVWDELENAWQFVPGARSAAGPCAIYFSELLEEI